MTLFSLGVGLEGKIKMNANQPRVSTATHSTLMVVQVRGVMIWVDSETQSDQFEDSK